MYKHRIAFTGAWIILVIALFVLPGFEIKCLMAGFIIGWWPFLIIGLLIGDNVYHHSILILIFIVGSFLLSGGTVYFCAWIMDRAGLTKKAWIVLIVSIIAGVALIYALLNHDFEQWKRSPEGSAVMESPALNHEPTRRGFYKIIVIPRMLLGGMCGLYGATVLNVIYASAVIILRKRRLNRRM